jgi:selenocysteine lyase/cysteine desulfurase
MNFSGSEEFLQWRREAFPFFQRKIFLTHASVAPLPHVVSQAIIDYATRISTEGQFDYVHDGIYTRCKERIARLIGGALASEVAFAGSTSHALGLVATAIDWKPGDNCIVADGDFPANVVTWKNLRHTHEVETRLIPYRAGKEITLDDIEPLIDERTRIVSLSSANFLSGCPLAIAPIATFLRERGILFCLDAIQTLGAIRLASDATESLPDFICADAHKWLLGPNGIAILWARQSALRQLRPAVLGWLAVRDRDNWYEYDTTPIDSAERFEPGARNMLGVIGLDAALGLLEEAGAATIETRVVALRDYAAEKLLGHGCRLLWQPASQMRSGILSFQPRSGETKQLYHALDQHFALSLRQDKAGDDWIRVSAHYMNAESDIDELVGMIPG